MREKNVLVTPSLVCHGHTQGGDSAESKGSDQGLGKSSGTFNTWWVTGLFGRAPLPTLRY